MAEANASSNDRRSTLIVGAITGAFGLYMCLVGVGMLPPPSRINGPVWLAAAAGLAFLCAGVSVMLRGLIGMDDRQSELPADAPLWVLVTYWLTAVIAAASLASIGTWIAFGYGDRPISISGPFTGPVGEDVGRTVFGIGTLLSWFIVVTLARHGARKIFGKKI
ncbi:MAG TPA: hypothetical protein VIJ52_00815 [Pseudolabrys sp.]